MTRSLIQNKNSVRGSMHNRVPDKEVPLRGRLEQLQSVRRYLEEHAEEFLEILTEISDYKSALYELEMAITTLDGAADEIHHYAPPRTGMLSAFMPPNVILYSYILYLLVPALYVERLEFRPSTQVKDQVTHLHDKLSRIHGLPINIRLSSQRQFKEESVEQADLVVFTGAYKNAEEIKSSLRKDQMLLFFGQGLNPVIVAPGADIGLAVRDSVQLRLLNSGQDCLGPDVLFVHESLVEQFTSRLCAELGKLRFGLYKDPNADYGPIFYEQTFDIVCEYLLDNSKNIVYGGSIDFSRRKIEPTVLLQALEDEPQVVELFSPIFNVVSYKDRSELERVLWRQPFIQMAIGASFYGHDPGILDILRRKHTVATNASLLTIEDGNSPFGGYGPMGNYISYGRELYAEPILISKAVAELVNLGGETQ